MKGRHAPLCGNVNDACRRFPIGPSGHHENGFANLEAKRGIERHRTHIEGILKQADARGSVCTFEHGLTGHQLCPERTILFGVAPRRPDRTQRSPVSSEDPVAVSLWLRRAARNILWRFHYPVYARRLP
jgi:hypothetical protein